MAKNYIQRGEVLSWENDTGSTVESGDPVVIGSLIGVALQDIEDGDQGSVQISGVFELPKATGSSWSTGDRLVWDDSEDEFALPDAISEGSGDVSRYAVAAGPAGSDDDTGFVLLGNAVGSVAE